MFQKKISVAWLVTAIAVYAAVLTLSIVIQDSAATTIVKLAGILFCLLYVVFNSPLDLWLVLAMLLTFVADLILAQNNTSVVGVIAFLGVQLLHFRRLSRLSNKGMLGLVGVIAAALLLNLGFVLLPELFLACGIYAGVSVANIVVAVRWRRQDPQNPHALAAALGFPLFAACDASTVISYLSLTGVIAAGIYAPINTIVWIFYYPAQIFIANSSKCDTIEAKKVS